MIFGLVYMLYASQNIWLLCLSLLLLTACLEPLNLDSLDDEKQKILVVSYDGQFATKSSKWSYMPVPQKVGKELVVGSIDSIIFQVSIRSESLEGRAIIELYDSTRHKVIRNSTLYSPLRYYKLTLRSPNLSYNIPHELVDIYVRYRSEKEGKYIDIGQSQSILIYYQ